MRGDGEAGPGVEHLAGGTSAEGVPTRERVLRRFAGAGVAVALVPTVVWLVAPWLIWVLAFAAAAVYAVGVPLSMWLERRAREGPGVLVRHVVAGSWAGGVLGFLLLPTGLFLGATAGGFVGAASAAVAVVVGLALPRRALWPVALLAPALPALTTSPLWWPALTTA